MNEEHWLQSLAKFAGQFYRKFPDVELDSLLTYILNQVHNLRLLCALCDACNVQPKLRVL